MSEVADAEGGQALTPEQAEFAETLRNFRDGLPAGQREAFDGILHAAAAHADAGGDDTAGYFMGILSGPAVAQVVRVVHQGGTKVTTPAGAVPIFSPGANLKRAIK